jgi:hypothetical protein
MPFNYIIQLEQKIIPIKTNYMLFNCLLPRKFVMMLFDNYWIIDRRYLKVYIEKIKNLLKLKLLFFLWCFSFRGEFLRATIFDLIYAYKNWIRFYDTVKNRL